LLQNKYCVWQEKYYWWLVLIFGIALPTGIGALYGRPLGGFLWGFALRMVLQNHVIFSINSLAHTWGKQTYSTKFEARDNWLLALISNGEGYHSFHHRFASDYRNGWRWFDWDPSKWFIGAMSYLGLTGNLKRTPKEKILAAKQNRAELAG
jgi:stearoyl-CoA desaturase (delta-9 desaturase)